MILKKSYFRFLPGVIFLFGTIFTYFDTVMWNPRVFVVIFSLILSASLYGQSIGVVKADDIIQRIRNSEDTTYVINFWATWCAPCVRELPHFEEINAQYSEQKVKVLLVSLDLKRDVETKLKAFVERRNLQSEVLYLDEKDPNVWIPKFTDRWEGVIPATLFYNKANDLNEFRAGSFEGEELKNLLKELIVIRD